MLSNIMSIIYARVYQYVQQRHKKVWKENNT